MIHIYFSPTYDAGVWLGSEFIKTFTVGYAHLGKLGLIDLFETQLGLKQPDSPNNHRTLDYMNALRECNDPQKFYSASFINDPMAVTEHLLKLRDQLIESGWNKNAILDHQKICDLAIIEPLFKNKSGLADRLNIICQKLMTLEQLPQISTIEVDINIDALPYLWQKLFKQILPKLAVTIKYKVPKTNISAIQNSDLHKLTQLRLHSDLPQNDGSFNIMIGRDPWESAKYLARHLCTLPLNELTQSVMIVPERHRGIILNAIQNVGLPIGGVHEETSYSRPALQILILAINLCWEPKDPSIALSLLTINGSPAHGSFRFDLIQSLDRSLHISGPTWLETLQTIETELLDQATNEEEKQKIAIRKKRILEFFSSPSYAVENGIPTLEFVTICQRVSDWLRKIWMVKKQQSFRDACEIAGMLSNYAKNIGEDTISRERLVHLLTDTIEDGISHNSMAAQASGIRIISNPSQIITKAEHIFWWDFSSANVQECQEKYFSKQEIQQLHDHQIFWLDQEKIALSKAEGWMNVIHNAKKKPHVRQSIN